MEWYKRLGPLAAGSDGWRDDLPLDPELPPELTIDCCAVRPPVHPMFLLRLQVFADWHRAAGRRVEILPPQSSSAAAIVASAGIVASPRTLAPEVLLPVTRLTGHLEVEETAGRLQRRLEYEVTELAPLAEAAFMGVSELAGNAVEHGRNDRGGYIVALDVPEPRRRAVIAIVDLGIGIPEHLRQRYPEWADDGFCIGQAMRERISGTGDPHRGNGYTATFETALTSALAGARLDVLSSNGFVRTEIVQERQTMTSFPPAQRRRGTWITYELVPVTTASADAFPTIDLTR